MELDELFDPVDTDPSIPDNLIERTLQYLPDLMRVDVERKRGSKSWKKINGFKLGADAAGDSSDTAESISATIIMIAQHDHEQEGDTLHYRAKYHVRDKKGQIKRKHFSFKLTEDGDDVEPTMDRLEEQEVLAVAFDRAIQLVEVQNRHIDSLNNQMLSQAQTQAGQTAPLLQTIETLINKYHEGLNMQATALQAIAEMERSTAESERKAERDKALLDILAVAAPKAFEQFGAWLAKKQGGDVPEGSSENGDGSEKEAPSAATGPPRSGPIQNPKAASGAPQPKLDFSALVRRSQPEETPVPTSEVDEKPLTLFAHAFRDTIESEQWMDLTDVLTKQEMKLLKDALSAEDDDATAEGIMAFKEALRPTKYLRLNRILDAEQREQIMKLLAVIDKHSDDDDEEEEEGEEGTEDEEAKDDEEGD